MRRFGTGVSITAGSLLLLGLLSASGALERLELLTHDARIATGLGRRAPDPRILIVWIDQESIDYLRRAGAPFPFPRSVYADAVRFLKDAGAKAVILDILFDQPMLAGDDRLLGEALAAGLPSALAMKLVSYRAGGFDEAETTRLRRRADPRLPPARAANGAVLPIPEVEEAAAVLGFANVQADADTVHRRYETVRSCLGGSYPSLALAGAMLAGDPTRLAAAARGESRIALNFRGPEFSYPRFKFGNVLESINQLAEGKEPLCPLAAFRDKVVVVGIHAEGYEDLTPTPVSATFPGPELVATAIDNLLNGDWLREAPPASAWLLAAAAGATGVLAVFLWDGVLAPGLLVLLLLLALGGASLWSFASGLLLPTAAPGLALVFASSGGFLWRLLVEGRQKRALRAAFSQYLAPEVVAEVTRDPEALVLGGQTRTITVLFSDLAGFTSYAEQQRPQDVVAFLNRYFTRMCDQILAQRGVIDKFIGDAIMALFNAPLDQQDHAARALRAAVGCLREMEALNRELAAAGHEPMQMRIGLHTGPAVVGNLGSSQRFDYTAVGDTVNLASRLEGACKRFDVRCLVSDATWRLAGGVVPGRELGLLRVAGRKEPIVVHEASPALDPELVAAYGRALAALRAGEVGARALFEQAGARSVGDPVARLYVQQLADPRWDGVFTLESK
jgi:adenylate cyclase